MRWIASNDERVNICPGLPKVGEILNEEGCSNID